MRLLLDNLSVTPPRRQRRCQADQTCSQGARASSPCRRLCPGAIAEPCRVLLRPSVVPARLAATASSHLSLRFSNCRSSTFRCFTLQRRSLKFSYLRQHDLPIAVVVRHLAGVLVVAMTSKGRASSHPLSPVLPPTSVSTNAIPCRIVPSSPRLYF